MHNYLMRFWARKRAASDAEFAAFSTQAIVALENRFEAPPHDRDGLFSIMMDRLDDLAHDIADHDFSDCNTLRTIKAEVEMQRTLAWRIEDRSNGAYRVVRENEKANSKRTDIELLAVAGNQKAVIEIKLADDRWSLSDLERALSAQLLGQYLRHDNCKAGCLLLTYDGSKKYWIHPTKKTRLNFSKLVDYLKEAAHELEVQNKNSIKLTVFGLDLRAPIPK
jgi:hypothetical protein